MLDLTLHAGDESSEADHGASWSTVGYGDRVPVTSEGRLVGVFLMLTGVALVGTFSGLAASWFLAPAARRNQTEIETLTHEVARLRDALERIAPGSFGRSEPGGP